MADIFPDPSELPPPDAPEQRAISVTDLIHKCNAAASGMSVLNPHKLLILNCGYALRQLVERLEQLVERLGKYENPGGTVQ